MSIHDHCPVPRLSRRVFCAPAVAALVVLAACGSEGNPTGPNTSPDVDAGQALVLDGDDFVSVPDSRSTYAFLHEDGEFTLEAWVRIADPEADRLQSFLGNTFTRTDRGFSWGYENRTGVAQKQFRLILNDGNGNYKIDSYADASALSDGQWHAVAVVGSGERITFYVDGTAVAGSGVIGTAPAIGPSARDLLIGDMHSSEGLTDFYLEGEIDEVRIWDEDLTGAQILENIGRIAWGNLLRDPDSNLLGYWRFDVIEDLGVGLEPGMDVRDSSVARRHGELRDDARLGRSSAF